MPLVTALSMTAMACLTRSAASPALVSTAVRARLTAVRSDAIWARLRARCLIILRFCFSADAILATGDLLEERVVNPAGTGSQGRRQGRRPRKPPKAAAEGAANAAAQGRRPRKPPKEAGRAAVQCLVQCLVRTGPASGDTAATFPPRVREYPPQLW